MKRIGIDVGGTNTDAVLMTDGRVEAAVKVPTTPDVTSGILDAIRRLRRRMGTAPRSRLSSSAQRTSPMLSVQRRDLTRIATIRIGAPATAALPPFCDWPPDLATLVDGGSWIIEGGHEFDGRPFLPLDIARARQAAREIRARDLRYVAVTSMFSSLNPSHEDAVAGSCARRSRRLL